MTIAVSVLLLLAVQSDCAKILGIFHVPSISHQVVFQPIWRELSLRGHEVTVLTPNPLNDPALTNLTEIDLGFLYGELKQIEKKMSGGMDHWVWNQNIDMYAKSSTEVLFAHHEVQRLIRDESREFDVVLVESHFPAPAIFSFVHECPLVGIASLALQNPFYELVGAPVHPVLYPDFSTNFGEELTFFEKVEAVLFYWYHRYKFYYDTLPALNRVVKKHFGGDVPNVEEIVSKNMSMVLLNTNPILNKPRPFGPNVIEMGGRMHLKPKKPLPQVCTHHKNFFTINCEIVGASRIFRQFNRRCDILQFGLECKVCLFKTSENSSDNRSVFRITLQNPMEIRNRQLGRPAEKREDKQMVAAARCSQTQKY